MRKLSVCLLVSGNLGLTLLNHFVLKKDCNIHSVFTDKKSDGIIISCKEKNIPCFVGDPRGGVTADFRNSLSLRPDLILSVNYLFLIEEVIEKILSENFEESLAEQDETKATYYPKRTPENGEIDWN